MKIVITVILYALYYVSICIIHICCFQYIDIMHIISVIILYYACYFHYVVYIIFIMLYNMTKILYNIVYN